MALNTVSKYVHFEHIDEHTMKPYTTFYVSMTFSLGKQHRILILREFINPIHNLLRNYLREQNRTTFKLDILTMGRPSLRRSYPKWMLGVFINFLHLDEVRGPS